MPGMGNKFVYEYRGSPSKLIGFLAVFLCLILVTLLWSYKLSLQKQIENAGRIEVLQARQGATIIKEALEERMAHLYKLGELPAVQYMDHPFMQIRMEEWFRTSSIKGGLHLSRVSAEGETLAEFGQLPVKTKRWPYPDDLQHADGRGRSARVTLRSGVEWSREDPLRIALILPIFENSTNPAHPRPTHRFTGLLIETLDLKQIIESWSLAQSDAPNVDSTYTCIVNKKGIILNHAMRPELIGKRYNFGLTKPDPEWESIWPVDHDNSRIVNLPDREFGKGQKQLISASMMKVDNLSWTIYRHTSYAKVTENLSRLLYVHTLLFLIFCAGGIGGAYLYSTKPIEALPSVPSARRGGWAGILTVTSLFLILVLWELIERTWFPLPSVISTTRHVVYFGRGVVMGVVGALIFYVLFTREQRAHAGALSSLRESRERLLATMNSTSDGILGITYTPDGEVISFCNKKFGEIFGVDPDLIIGRKCSDAREQARTWFPDPGAFDAEVENLYKNRAETRVEELEVIHPRNMILERFAGPILDDRGTIVGRIWSFRDVTEKKKLERQFLQAQKMEAVGTLTGGIAHDFNNILTAILGYSDFLLQERNLPEGTRNPLDKIRRSAERGAALIKHMMAYSRQSAPQLKTVNLNLLLENIYPLCVQTLPKEIRIELEMERDLPFVLADSVEIEQVVLNLSLNARDAMPEGGIIRMNTRSLIVDETYKRFHPEAGLGRYAVLSISDTGTGMDEETLKHVFEPFFTTKEPGRGTGLGLSVVHGIVKNHGGWVTVYSHTGEGTRFSIHLPTTDKTDSESGIIEISPPGGSETILVIDDEVVILELTRAILESAGYTALTAADGEQGLHMLNTHISQVKLVILDWSMPNMSGKVCLQKIAADHPGTRVLISSGLPPESLKSASGIQTSGFIPKPYKASDLLLSVRKALDS